MKVWIVFHNDPYGSTEILDVFDSKRKADKYIKENDNTGGYVNGREILHLQLAVEGWQVK